MKILVVGSGGREHALCETISRSPLVSKLYAAPGNPGMKESLPSLEILPRSFLDQAAIRDFVLQEKIDLVVIGPEDAIEKGLTDFLREKGVNVFGPSKAAGQVESSKAFAKKLMKTYGVPTANYQEFKGVNGAKEALKYLEQSPNHQHVVKCDFLAQGKGVIVCQNKDEAKSAVLAFMEERLLGENRDHIIIEDFLEGKEVSFFALTDGDEISFLGSACDHKRLRDGDEGPNTGGMGVFSPPQIVSADDEEWILKNIFTPMIQGMKKEGIPFSGVLFAGLMKTPVHGWQVIEFNARFGDPETQALLPLIDEDLVPWFLASADGTLSHLKEKLGRKSPLLKKARSLHVVMAAHGYPGTEGIKIRSGDPISFDADFLLGPNEYLYFAGVGKIDDKLVTKGGRILGVTALGNNYKEARATAYHCLKKIYFDGAHFRQDIGLGLDL